MMLKRLICSLAFIASIGTTLCQSSDADAVPAGTWIASCDEPKLKFDEGYEICLMTIDTGAYDPGYFSSEFYFAVDYVANGEIAPFDCTNEMQAWEDWGINLYFSFSFSGSYSEDHLLFDAGEGYSYQNSYQLKPEFIKIDAEYQLVDSDQLKLLINGQSYIFYRVNSVD